MSRSGTGLFATILGIFRFISGLILLYYFFLFLIWYIKGHFGKYFIFFWAFTIFSFFVYQSETRRMEREHQEYMQKWGNKTGQEIWNENMKDYDPVRGY